MEDTLLTGLRFRFCWTLVLIDFWMSVSDGLGFSECGFRCFSCRCGAFDAGESLLIFFFLFSFSIC